MTANNKSAVAVDAVFFDLDGTLIDSAPDLVVAMQRLRAQLGEHEADVTGVGAVVSKGGRAMMRAGFPGIVDARIDELLPRFLDLYAESIAVHTRVYPGVAEMLQHLEARAIRWGIVTNKPGRLARAVVTQLGWEPRHSALVTGDCLPQRKPEPQQLLHAAALSSVVAGRSVYVGDDARDIEAGQRAGMRTIAVGWGYLAGEDPESWGADHVIAHPSELLHVLDLA